MTDCWKESFFTKVHLPISVLSDFFTVYNIYRDLVVSWQKETISIQAIQRMHYKQIQVSILMNENNSENYNVFHSVKQYGYSI